MRLRIPLASSCLVLLITVTASVSAQDIFVTPIPGSPFSGVVNVERSIIHNDGSITNLKSFREIGRDSHGRIHNEMRSLVTAFSKQEPELIRIRLYDPQTRVSTILDATDRTFWTQVVNHPPSTVPPALFHASPTGNSLPANEFTKQEDLGIRDIEGLAAHGVREIQTISAVNNGGKEIVITDEYWYSDDLRINLMVKHDDPRKSKVTLTVTHIALQEPRLGFFEIPENYKPADAEPESPR